jgi:chorismate mutase
MRYLTKSRFKMGLDCPTKLFYTKKPEVYADKSSDDPFLRALADGGFQAGELAKCYYPDGIEIEGLDYEKTWLETQEHLKKENVILYEAALKFNNLFVRVDILKKTGSKIELIEVKSKSFNAKTFSTDIWQIKNPNKLDSGWKPYIFDIAFQAYVAKLAFPQFEIKSFLMCSDKDKIATIDGLNQKFLIQRISERETKIKKIGNTSKESLGNPILTAIEITDVVDKIHNEAEESEKYKDFGFKATVDFFADHYGKDLKIEPEVGNGCKSCEFRANEAGLKNGFNECWRSCHSLTDDEIAKPFAFDVWFTPKLKNPKILMEEIVEGDFVVKTKDAGGDGLSRSQRQWLQIEKVQNNDSTEHIDQDGIKRLFETFTYPLHFIDFETSMVAIPFNKGRHPYEQTAFQFSHHVMQKDGSYEHAGEWISTEPGKFPNFDFVRALKKELEKDKGSIFRYSNHENTVLNQIRKQLQNSEEVDRDELIAWMETITHKKNEKKAKGMAIFEWCGDRDMVDLCEIVKDFYYHPATKGSNSIKAVLPAVLKTMGRTDDPYKDLPPVFEDYDRETLDLMFGDDELANGGAAMTAYALMQFSVMTDQEREKIREALLRYCKLDTEAMIWIYQYLNKTK